MTGLAQRHHHILTRLRSEGAVKVLNLSEELAVSTVTIRKDLKYLEDKGLLFRVHGGAASIDPYINERPVDEKEFLHADQKDRIGRAAARLVGNDDTIIIASGTTVLSVARHIQVGDRLTVLAASVNVALELIKKPKAEVIQLGGILRKTSFSTVGPYCESMLQDFFCNKLFLGIDGLDLEFGLTTTSVQEAHLNQLMIERAQRVVVVSDSSKFGRKGFGKICDLREIDQIITDREAPEHYVKALQEEGIEVTLV